MNKLLLAIVFCFVSGVSFAADGDLFSVGDPQAGQVEFRIDGNGKLVGQKITAEVITTSDTVTAAETGKVFIYEPASTTSTITLPTAAAGLVYTFKQAVGSAYGTKYLILNPQDTDTFVGCVSSTAATTFAAGDALKSTTATGDSVTLVGASTKWYCVDREGVWTDAN